MIIGFVIWMLVGCGFIGYGIYLMLSKREAPVGFWANEKEPPQVTDVKGYNRALGKLFGGYGIAFILLGLPMLGGQNSAGVVFTVLGAAWASIALAIIYSTVILKKYQKR
ncbi:MAG: hypothetical protein J1E03_11565 [Acetatifactor sp.]|nr:hypothetical protein [Acetatifactor sp.]